nr:MAG TPA: hypothetical protein [Caudoviricetes sp.]
MTICYSYTRKFVQELNIHSPLESTVLMAVLFA